MFDKIFAVSNKSLESIQKSVDRHKIKVDKLVEEIKIGKTFKENYMDVLFDICEYMNIFVWKKDKNHLYNFSNINHCVNFLGLQPECVNEINGFSDTDLIGSYKARTGKENTFNEICALTDDCVKNNNEVCNFIEGGYIDNEEVLLYVKKIPLFENNNFNGSLGIAQECKNKNLVMGSLNKWIKGGNAKLIYGRNKQVFCYQICHDVEDVSIFSFLKK